MKKAIVAVILIAVGATVFVMAAGCEDRNPSDTEYWFSEDTYEFVPYSEKIRISTMPEAIGILLPPRR